MRRAFQQLRCLAAAITVAAVGMQADAELHPSKICGNHAAYLYLQCHGVAADYAAIRGYNALSEDGLSAFEIVQIVGSYGLEASARHVTDEQLFELNAFPYILHATNHVGGSNHYYVVTGRDSETDDLYGIDPTTARAVRFERHDLPVISNGVVIHMPIAREGLASFATLVLTGSIVVSAAFGGWAFCKGASLADA